MKHIESEWTNKQLKEGIALNLKWIEGQEEELKAWVESLEKVQTGKEILEAMQVIKDLKKDIKRMKKDLNRIWIQIGKRAL